MTTLRQLEDVTDHIFKNYSEQKLAEMIDEVVPEFLDDGWDADGEYTDYFEWYNDHNNNEARDQIYNEIIGEVFLKLGYKTSNTEHFCACFDTLENTYNF